ncbi:hypothetical protein ACFQVA_21335 [Actinomadura keratinilytica]
MRSDLLQLPAVRARLARFRTQALASGVPAEEIARWTAAARPCLTLTPDGDGPVVARLGGPALVPPRSPGLPHPRYHHVVTVDLAALPASPTCCPCPPGDGSCSSRPTATGTAWRWARRCTYPAGRLSSSG